jgi:hypothetical protein
MSKYLKSLREHLLHGSKTIVVDLSFINLVYELIDARDILIPAGIIDTAGSFVHCFLLGLEVSKGA